MEAILKGIAISPVNMEDRKELGIKAGDTVRVHQKIQDKDKTRIQVFEGLVLARKHGNEPGATFTVRKVVDGIGVEKIFPLYSPLIDKIEITRRSKVRRAKLYYIREKVAREIKRQMRRMKLVDLASMSEAETAQKAEEAAKKADKVNDEVKDGALGQEDAAKAAEVAEATPAVETEAPEVDESKEEETTAEPEASEAKNEQKNEEIEEAPKEEETPKEEEKEGPAEEAKEEDSEKK